MMLTPPTKGHIVNLKEAFAKQGKQALTDRINKLFHYDRDSGKLLKIISNHNRHWESYISGLVSAVSKGDPDERKTAEDFLNYFKSNVELQQQKIDQLKSSYPPELKDTTVVKSGRYHTVTFDHVIANVTHIVWFLETGEIPDRIRMLDGDHSNTRFSNLSTSADESAPKLFQALVLVNGRQKNLGMFATREEVTKARDDYRDMHGLPKRKPGRPLIEKVNTMKPYQAVVLYGGRQYNLGRFDTREQVKQAREAFRKAREVGMVAAAPDKPAVVAVELPAWMVIEPVAPKETTTSQQLPDWMR